MQRYKKIKNQKEEYHRKHHTKFIKLDYMPKEDLLKNLENQLINMGFKLFRRSDREIFYRMLDNNPIAEVYHFKDLLYTVIDRIKSLSGRNQYKNIVDNYIANLNLEQREKYSIQFKYINDFYLYYQKRLFATMDYGFDFSDMIYYANLHINKIGVNNRLDFQYLIIDEYQDISQERYEFTHNIAKKNNAKVVAVGDDWQSIFAFAGSKIEYIYNFEKFFEGAKLLKITKTYRNSKELIDYSGKFVMKNDQQIKKELVSDKNIHHPIKFIPFDEFDEYNVLKKLILTIHKNNPDHDIMILARTNKIISKCYEDSELKDEIGTKIKYIGYEDIDIDGMTIHKSKGLTSDEVILIGLNQNFPSSNINTFWVNNLFMPYVDCENIPFAEERRLFYVALTRTKNYVYLLVNRNPKLRSPFIQELYDIIIKQEERERVNN